MTAIREIDVRKQAQLSFARVFRLVLAGIKHRFFRSFLTMAVILLAVAFFMAMLSESVFVRATARGVSAEIADARDATRRLGLYFKPPPTTLLLAGALADLDGRDGDLAEYAAVSGIDPDDLARLVADAGRERAYLEFMDRLKVGLRLILFQQRHGRAAFLHLLPAGAWKDFLGALHGLRSVRLPEPSAEVAARLAAARPAADASGPAAAVFELGDLPARPAVRAFRDFLDGFPDYLDRLQRFDARWRAALARLGDASRDLTGGDDLGLVHWLAHASDADAEAWRRLVVDAGFRFDSDAFAAMRGYLRTADRRNRLRRELASRTLRARWQLAFPERRFTIDEKLAMLDRPDAVALTEPYPARELEEAARFFADPGRLGPFFAVLARQPPQQRGEDEPELPAPAALALELQKVDAAFVEPGALEPAALNAWFDDATPEAAQMFGEVALQRFARLTTAERRELQRVLQLAERVARLRADLAASPEVLAAWAARPNRAGGDSLEEKFAYLARPGAVALWPRNTPAELAEVARLTVRENRLNDLEADLAAKLGGPIDRDRGVLTGKQLFLLLISFCVCMVGIANAMLMAITERFREIATMKCLGATDGFILLQFMMEAGIQGLIGGVLGMVAGLALALVKNGWIFGAYLWRYFPALDLAACGVVCVFAGVALAVFASLYPSWAASRMAPMEAMRVE